MKRVLNMGDTHCGHVVGLTPPEWQFHATGDKYHDKYAKIQDQMWTWFVEHLTTLKPIHGLIFNGDAVEGKGSRSGGTELITSDMIQQGKMIDRIVEIIEPQEIAMTFGTPYHTGINEDMEQVIADRIGASIESHLERDVEGVRIDARHFIWSSSIPHGRFTALARENLWRLIWADRSEKFAPHIILRSHVHYFGHCGDEYSSMFTLPCLQGLGSKFGSRVCSGSVSLGFLVLDCENGKFTPIPRILPVKEQVSEWKPWL